MRLPWLLALTLAATSCIPFRNGHVLAKKAVLGKSADALIADDGSRCGASPRVVEETPIGAMHSCLWSPAPNAAKRDTRAEGSATPGKVKRPSVPPKSPKG